MKYCTDCKHFESFFNPYTAQTHKWCGNPAARDPVGNYPTAEDARSRLGLCGLEAKLFEPIPPPRPIPPSFWQRAKAWLYSEGAQ